MPVRTSAHLPCPGVRFEAGFVRRLERLVPRLAQAREKREGAGKAGLAGGGLELVGFKSYRPGDDPRDLDWNLLARLDRPFVRVTRREAGERWIVALDASASMGVGPPGKLQRAAEVVAGIAALALRLRAEVCVVAAAGDPAGTGAPREILVRRRAALPDLLSFLEGLTASGSADPRPLARHGRALSRCARVFLVGDGLGSSPQDALALLGPGRELAVIRVLAPVELAPAALGAVEWWDPEKNARIALELDERSLGEYEAALSSDLERWRTALARAGAAYGCFSSAAPFEEVLERVLLS